MAAPTKYNPNRHPKELMERMAEGWLDYEIYADWNVTHKTFMSWRNTYPEMQEAYEAGLVKCEAWWSKFARKMMDGTVEGKHAFNGWIAIMNNKFRKQGWGKTDQSEGNTINIGNMQVLQTQSPDQLLSYIQQVSGKLKQAGILELDYKVLDDEENGNTGTSEDSSGS